MKTYTTILLDIDSITYELHNHRRMHGYNKEMLEQLLKKGIRSLQDFEVIALLGKNENYGKSYIQKNRLNYIKVTSREELETSKKTGYLEKILKYYDRNKKEVLVVSGNEYMLKTASLLGIDTCYFNITNPKHQDTKTTLTIKKLEELIKYRYVNKPKEEIEDSKNMSSNYHYYIDPELLKILEDKKVALIEPFDSDKTIFLNRKQPESVNIAITMDLFLAMNLKKEGCSVYFVNNHYNDSIDYVADYELSIENLPSQLAKIMKK